MSQFTPGVIKSFVAGEDLSSYQYCFVAATGTGSGNNLKVSHATENANTLGILLNAPAAAGRGAAVIISGSAKLKVSEAIPVGSMITSGSTAQGEVVDAADEFCGAIALEYAAEADDIIEVRVGAFTAHAA